MRSFDTYTIRGEDARGKRAPLPHDKDAQLIKQMLTESDSDDVVLRNEFVRSTFGYK